MPESAPVSIPSPGPTAAAGENSISRALPAWADAFWALGVWGALGGSVLLLLRSRFAFHAFAVSLVGLMGTTIYTLTSGMPAELNSAFSWIFTAVIWIVTILLAWYARRMTAVGVLR